MAQRTNFQPFDLIDDGLVLAILRCLDEPKSLGCAALVGKRLAVLCEESYAWKPLLDSALSSSGEGFLALPSEGASWRERYKQLHALSSLSSEHNGLLADLWMLWCDLAGTGTASWELVAPSSEHTPIGRARATLSPVSLSSSAHLVGLLLFGGYDENYSNLDEVWLFDTRTAAWTMLPPHTAQAADASVRPDARAGHSAITHNSSSEVVIFGGFAYDHVLSFNNVLSFSVRTRQWTLHECAGASPSRRYGHSACRVAENMYVFGGHDSNEDSLNDLWEYALDARAWTQVICAGGNAPSLRWGHSLTPLGNRLVVFGGRDRLNNSFDSALHCFDLQRRRWSDLLAVSGEHPRERTYHAAIPCGGGVLIFGGSGSGNERFNDTFLLCIPCYCSLMSAPGACPGACAIAPFPFEGERGTAASPALGGGLLVQIFHLRTRLPDLSASPVSAAPVFAFKFMTEVRSGTRKRKSTPRVTAAAENEDDVFEVTDARSRSRPPRISSGRGALKRKQRDNADDGVPEGTDETVERGRTFVDKHGRKTTRPTHSTTCVSYSRLGSTEI
ncbi:hypothetical protein T492DRAFT_911656 [Pavlovales sp. CCMP2436]|nr:hypothetical protein T492DRAFT_911656 [Pavlovales sp. CCMP2436]